MQLSAAKDAADTLRAMTGDMVSSSDLADLTRSAEAVEDRSKELASKQAETLEQVSEELLCSPEIIRQVPVSRSQLAVLGQLIMHKSAWYCMISRQLSVWDVLLTIDHGQCSLALFF